MNLFTLLQLSLAASVLFCAVLLTVMVLRTFTFGKRPTYAHPRGSRLSGAVYAFTQGMLPWEKETASRHIWTYIGGILYHLGIFGAMLFLVMVLLRISLSATLLQVMRILLLLGLVSGMTLLIKRIFKPHMRFLSCGDDYLANILVDLLLLSALATTFNENVSFIFSVMAIIIFIYIPFGKIRHCVFFFYSRILFGDFFGRRGVIPHSSEKA
jgi:nitrate reductase gamma subunit